MTPPFRAINAFYATARSGSMLLAAEDLGVTPSAVSQQIQILEAHVGTKLFNRTGRRVVLNEDGERYFDMIRDEVERILVATEQMRGTNSYTILNVRIAPTFATKWVLPRLPDFIAANPDIELRLDATNEPPDFGRENIDLEVRHGAGGWRGLYVESLIEERMEVLCAPDFAAPRSLEAADLQSYCLLHSVKNVVQWSHWFEQQGITPQTVARRLFFDRAHMSIDMACEGVGIALESHLTASKELAEGRLIHPLRHSVPMPQKSLWLVCPHSHLNRRKVRRFSDWLQSTLKDVSAERRDQKPF